MRVILLKTDSDKLKALMYSMAKCIPNIEIVDEPMEGINVKESGESHLDDMDGRMSLALRMLKEDGTIRYQYDYTWVMVAIGDGAVEGMAAFRSPQSFMDYLQFLGVEPVPSRATISTWYNRVVGKYPQWEFTDTTDPRETMRRKNVIRELICALKGTAIPKAEQKAEQMP